MHNGVGIQLIGLLFLINAFTHGHIKAIFHGFIIVREIGTTLTGDADRLGLGRNVDVVKMPQIQQLIGEHKIKDPIQILVGVIVISGGGGKGNGLQAKTGSLTELAAMLLKKPKKI